VILKPFMFDLIFECELLLSYWCSKVGAVATLHQSKKAANFCSKRPNRLCHGSIISSSFKIKLLPVLPSMNGTIYNFSQDVGTWKSPKSSSGSKTWLLGLLFILSHQNPTKTKMKKSSKKCLKLSKVSKSL